MSVCRTARCIALLGLALMVTACTFKRTNVSALSQQQSDYYDSLLDTLKDRRALLADGLATQVQANAVRRANLLNWERDLRDAEVLLQVDADVTGNRKLLSMKLAELNLQDIARQSQADTDQAQRQAILSLYDELSRGIAALRKNNQAITTYLGSSDAAFALSSFDTGSVVRSISALRGTLEELGKIDARNEEQRAREARRLEQSLERAREVLLRVYAQGEE